MNLWILFEINDFREYLKLRCYEWDFDLNLNEYSLSELMNLALIRIMNGLELKALTHSMTIRGTIIFRKKFSPPINVKFAKLFLKRSISSVCPNLMERKKYLNFWGSSNFSVGKKRKLQYHTFHWHSDFKIPIDMMMIAISIVLFIRELFGLWRQTVESINES